MVVVDRQVGDDQRVPGLGAPDMAVGTAIATAGEIGAALVVLRVSLAELSEYDALRAFHSVVPEARIVVLSLRDTFTPPPADLIWPPADMAEVRSGTLDPRPTSAGVARRWVTEACDRPGCRSIVAEAAVVVTELVTNAVTHARTALTVTVRISPGGVRIAVRDGGKEWPALHPNERMGACGRGFVLLDGLCSAWGLEPFAGGKTTWAQISAP